MKINETNRNQIKSKLVNAGLYRNEIVLFDLNRRRRRRQLKDGGPQVPQLVEASEVGGLRTYSCKPGISASLECSTMLLGLRTLYLRLEEGLWLGEDLLHADDLVAVLIQGLHEVDNLRLGGDEAGGPDRQYLRSHHTRIPVIPQLQTGGGGVFNQK